MDLKQEYEKVLASGMFWEFHPELTGEWEKDKDKFKAYRQPVSEASYYIPVPQKQWEQKPVCSITEEVKRDLDESAAKGLAEYGCTLDRQDLSLLDWMKHAYAETLDKAKYLKKAIKLMENEAKGHD